MLRWHVLSVVFGKFVKTIVETNNCHFSWLFHYGQFCSLFCEAHKTEFISSLWNQEGWFCSKQSHSIQEPYGGCKDWTTNVFLDPAYSSSSVGPEAVYTGKNL